MTKRLASMVPRIGPFVMLIAAVLAGDCGQTRPGRAGAFAATIVQVEDGDSATARRANESIRIRLEGIDAPELDQAYGVEARNHLRTLISGRLVTVESRGFDRYGRMLARLVVDGEDVSEMMVAAGCAWHYREYSADPRLAALEDEARAAGRGLWGTPDARAPWDDRARDRAHRAQSSPAPASNKPAAAGPYRGNTISHVYHAPGCKDYDCKHCTAVFATPEAAEAAGYRPHQACVRR